LTLPHIQAVVLNKNMQTNKKALIRAVLLCAMLIVALTASSRAANQSAVTNSRANVEDIFASANLQSATAPKQNTDDKAKAAEPTHRAPTLGSDLVWADGPHILIEAWQNKALGDSLNEILQTAGVRSLRMSFHGMYSHQGEEASAKIKAENKMTNEYPWFPFADFANYMAAHDITTIIGINVEEGAEVAADTIHQFTNRAGQACALRRRASRRAGGSPDGVGRRPHRARRRRRSGPRGG
jgi:hypothetical protein